MFTPPHDTELQTESDVEQKFAMPFLVSARPQGLGFLPAEIFTKPNIRHFKIGKGVSSKLYFPDYIVTFDGLPVLIVEAKAPGEDLAAAAGECRLYAGELNAEYPHGINPVKFCMVTDGLRTELRGSDSDEIMAQFGLGEVSSVAPSFADLTRILDGEALKQHAKWVCGKMRPPRYFRTLNLIGGQTAQNEQIAYNDFGRVLAANFQSIFDPASYDDRLKIVQNAYVGSRRKERFISEIDRIIRNSSPMAATEALLIENTDDPKEISGRFNDLPSLKNKVLLLIGEVGTGKSTFIDYLREKGIPEEIKKQTAWVRIDLNPAPVSAEEIYPWLRKEIIAGIRRTSPDIDTFLLENLKKVYQVQVREFDEGIGALFEKTSPEYFSRLADMLSALTKDEMATIRGLERYLCTARGRLLIVVLDNCDKRNRDEQLLMFQVAKYIQQEIRCLIILPLRHQTYENHRHEPPLDTALKDLVYRIEPPPFQEVLTRRLGLVVSEAKKLGPNSLVYKFGNATVKLSVERLETFLHAMMGALFDHKQYGRNIIVGLAGWNIRRAFEIFIEFCRSGFISEDEIFGRQISAGQAQLPQGVVAKVLLRTNRRYYDGNQAYVKNLFQCVPTSSSPCSFLRYWILAWFRGKKDQLGPSGIKGYHKQEHLVADFLLAGLPPEAVREEVRYLAKAGCVLAEHLRSDSIDDRDLLVLTPSGHVHLELAYHDINYLAACAEDSWVSSFDLADTIRSRVTQQPYFKGLSWSNMLANAYDFCTYLMDRQSETRLSRFVPDQSIPLNEYDFEKTLTEISEQQRRLASGYQNYISTLRVPDEPSAHEDNGNSGK